MALEIRNTNGEISINGNASEGQITQDKSYLKALMTTSQDWWPAEYPTSKRRSRFINQNDRNY